MYSRANAFKGMRNEEGDSSFVSTKKEQKPLRERREAG